jgi:hypothetical protein
MIYAFLPLIDFKNSSMLKPTPITEAIEPSTISIASMIGLN